MKRLMCLSVMLLAIFALPAAAAQDNPVVLVVPLDGTVGTVMENYVTDILKRAPGEASVVVFRLDTPGGLVTSMTEITMQIIESEVPVVMWVSPSGARAASAGAFLVVSAHVAAMAPGTRIGAAHPVLASGEGGDEIMQKKVASD